ncbi:hypothetical protein FOMPIDRAFT_1017517 [Fomitopsis schrenkii]|uniref:Uncharacterized protein n=1 Tax=Fomitopsis schrenkii TaxID=2126942 RepID=S8E5D9_FOMSC|nr:hypothetical protein FOMPIDRAFT_1017517 [Fomitopsis schrenkii]
MSQATGIGTATNRTIDDNYGDSVTGAKPTYSDGWNYGPDCSKCYVQPVVSDTFDRSWHDVTASPDDPAARDIMLTFTGTAVWVYGIVPNYVQSATTLINISFELDGQTTGSFVHVPLLTEDYEYNVTLYSNTALENVQHTLVMTPQRQTNASYMAFDWAQYTFEDVPATTSSRSAQTTTSSGGDQTTNTGTSSTSTGALVPSTSVHAGSQRSSHTTPAGAIAGGVVGGIVLIVLLVVAALLYHRRGRGGVDQIVHTRRGGTQRSDIEPAAQVNPFVDSGMSQANVRAVTAGMRGPSRMTLLTPLNSASATTPSFHATNAPDDDPLTSSTNLWAFPADIPGASRDALVSPSPHNSPVLPTFPVSTSRPSSASRATRPGQMSQPRLAKTLMRREELSRQMRDIENTVADLRRRQSSQSRRTMLSPGSPTAPPLPGIPLGGEDGDAALRRQIEALQLEVKRLRVEQESLLSEPPPAYQHEES